MTASAASQPDGTLLSRARAGDGPSLIEALTYRHGGHSRADPAKYRSKDETDAWLARDRPVREGGEVVWVPPVLVGRPF